MIVNYTKDGWAIITQRNHGLIAAALCAHWAQPFEDRWLETIIAVAEHDDAYNELMNDDVLNDQGGPLNFNMRPFRRDFCETLLLMALSKSKYIALLISYHIQFLYDHKSAAAHAYCESLKPLQHAWLKEMNMGRKEGKQRYRLLQWCDALSLIICQEQVPPEGRKVDISVGPDDRNYELFTVGNTLSVYPWPFKEKDFSLPIECRVLTSLVFEDVKAFQKQLKEAPAQVQMLFFKQHDK